MFFKKSPKEKFIAQEKKILDNRTKRSLRLAQYASELNESKFVCETAIDVQRENALQRRKKHLGDNMQQMYIHDAAVCLLAIEEAQIELNALAMIQDLQKAEKSLQKVLGKMYSVNHYLSLTGRDVKSKLGMEFDDSEEPTTFSERADLVDKGFVEKLIGGATIEECLESIDGTAGRSESLADMFGDIGGVAEDLEAKRKRIEEDATET